MRVCITSAFLLISHTKKESDTAMTEVLDLSVSITSRVAFTGKKVIVLCMDVGEIKI